MINKRSISTPVTTAAAVIVSTAGHNFPLTVKLIPGSGGTLLCESSNTPGAGANPPAGGATFDTEFGGAQSTTYKDVFIGPVTALRFTATTADGTVEITS